MPSPIADALRALADAFDRLGADWYLFGAQAALLRGSRRFTEDVDVTVFLTDMKRDFPSFNRLYAEHFADNQPTRTTVEINCLPTPIAVEPSMEEGPTHDC